MKSFKLFKQTLYVSKEVIKLIWETSPRYTVYMLIILAVTAVIPIAEAYFIKRIIDTLTESTKIPVAFETVLIYVGLFVLIILISRFVESQRNAIQLLLGNLFNKYIHHKLVEKTTQLDFWRFEDPKFHDKLDRTRDQATWKPLNTFYYLFESVQSSLTLIFTLLVLYSLNPWLIVLIVLLSTPSLIVQIKYGREWWNLLYQETPRSRLLNYYQHLMTSSHEIKDIKLLNLRNSLLIKYKKLYNRLFNEQKRLVNRRYLSEFFCYLISDIVLVIFYVILAWKTYIQKVTIGDFTFYSMIYTRGGYLSSYAYERFSRDI